MLHSLGAVIGSPTADKHVPMLYNADISRLDVQYQHVRLHRLPRVDVAIVQIKSIATCLTTSSEATCLVTSSEEGTSEVPQQALDRHVAPKGASSNPTPSRPISTDVTPERARPEASLLQSKLSRLYAGSNRRLPAVQIHISQHGAIERDGFEWNRVRVSLDCGEGA